MTLLFSSIVQGCNDTWWAESAIKQATALYILERQQMDQESASEKIEEASPAAEKENQKPVQRQENNALQCIIS